MLESCDFLSSWSGLWACWVNLPPLLTTKTLRAAAQAECAFGKFNQIFFAMASKAEWKIGHLTEICQVGARKEGAGRRWSTKMCVWCFLHYCCIRGVSLPRKFGMQRWWIQIQQSPLHLQKLRRDVPARQWCNNYMKMYFQKDGPLAKLCAPGDLSAESFTYYFLKILITFPAL